MEYVDCVHINQYDMTQMSGPLIHKEALILFVAMHANTMNEIE